MSQTIGQQLKQARVERNLSVEKVVESTRIRARHIEAIEADEFDALPSPVQARAFLRIYAEFLELSLDNLIARQRSGNSEQAAELPKTEPAKSPKQQPIPVGPGLSTVDAFGEPAQDGYQTMRAKLKNFFHRSSHFSTRSKDSASLEKPAEAIVPSEPDLAANTGVEPVEVRSEGVFPPAETPPASSEPGASQRIFASIGDTLRQRRETLSLTFDEIERHTHVRTHYLQALENGDFNHLPSSVQARGMLNNYARFLDMDVDKLLLQFAGGLQTLRLERQPKPPEEQQNQAAKTPFKINLPPNLRRYISMDIIVGGGLILLLLVFAIWGTSRVIGLSAVTTPQSTAPSISDILGITPAGDLNTPSPTNENGAGTLPPVAGATAIVSVPASGQGVVHIVVVALQSAWVRVVVDEKTMFEGRIVPGAAYPFDGNSQIEVRTGNGAAISILYNESNLGVMGTLGEVVDHIYTANAILNPTATFTPSPTITPVPSKTPRPSATLRPSITPRRSPTPTQ